LSDAIRVSDISTILSTRYEELCKDDLNFPEDWSLSTKRETDNIMLELHLLIAVERSTNPTMRQIGRVLIYLIHPGGNAEEKGSRQAVFGKWHTDIIAMAGQLLKRKNDYLHLALGCSVWKQ